MRITFQDYETFDELGEWAAYYDGVKDTWLSEEPKFVPRKGDIVMLEIGPRQVERIVWLSPEEVMCYVK